MSAPPAGLVAALLAAAAAALLLPAVPRTRLRVQAGSRSTVARTKPPPGVPAGPVGKGAVVAASMSCGVGVVAAVGGGVGLLLGAVAAVSALVVLPRLEPRVVRERRDRLAADMPLAVDLLAACLAAGRPPAEALQAVGAALGGPLADELGVVTVRLALGADPVAVWRELGRQDGPLAPLARTMARSTETGAPMAEGLRQLGPDLRRRRRAALEQRARSVGVRAAAPLGLCFLPAFVLIGIVPSIAAAFGALSLW